MNQQKIIRIGTIIYALIIASFGIGHFLKGTGLQTMVPRFIPGGIVWAYITGAALIAAAVAIIIGKYIYGAGVLLAVFLFTTALAVHLPAVMNASEEWARRVPMNNFLKDMAMGGAALIIAGLSRLKLT